MTENVIPMDEAALLIGLNISAVTIYITVRFAVQLIQSIVTDTKNPENLGQQALVFRSESCF